MKRHDFTKIAEFEKNWMHGVANEILGLLNDKTSKDREVFCCVLADGIAKQTKTRNEFVLYVD